MNLLIFEYQKKRKQTKKHRNQAQRQTKKLYNDKQRTYSINPIVSESIGTFEKLKK